MSKQHQIWLQSPTAITLTPAAEARIAELMGRATEGAVGVKLSTPRRGCSGLAYSVDYVTEELPELVAAHFPADLSRQSILGHSMGGHGALTVALRHPDRYRAASAFSPIVAPSHVPWGIKALGGYLGDDKNLWRSHDAVALIEDGARFRDFLVDYGDADPFLTEQLRPELLAQACSQAGIPLTLRRQPGYDHSYYFISTFMDDHLRWHAAHLKAAAR